MVCSQIDLDIFKWSSLFRCSCFALFLLFGHLFGVFFVVAVGVFLQHFSLPLSHSSFSPSVCVSPCLLNFSRFIFHCSTALSHSDLLLFSPSPFPSLLLDHWIRSQSARFGWICVKLNLFYLTYNTPEIYSVPGNSWKWTQIKHFYPFYEETKRDSLSHSLIFDEARRKKSRRLLNFLNHSFNFHFLPQICQIYYFARNPRPRTFFFLLIVSLNV